MLTVLLQEVAQCHFTSWYWMYCHTRKWCWTGETDLKKTMLMLNVLTEKVLGYQMMLNVLGHSGPLVNVEYIMWSGHWPDCAGKQDGVLWNDCQFTPQFLQGDSLGVLFIHVNFSFTYVNHAEQAQGQGRLPASCATTDSDLEYK